jgi:hypothetical protein
MWERRPRRAAPVAASSATLAGALLASLVLVAAGDVAPDTHARSETGGITSAFRRPPAHPALDLADARVRRARPRRRALSETASILDDVPEQVHLIPGGANEMVVVWATSHVSDTEATVSYAIEDEDEKDGAGETDFDHLESRPSHATAAITTTAYTAQICLGESMSIDPVMGDRDPVDLAALTRLANTSTWAPADAGNRRVARSVSDVFPDAWFEEPPWEKALCLEYNNPDSQYQSPFIRLARLSGLKPGETYRYRLPGDPPGASGGAAARSARAFVALPAPGSTPKKNDGGIERNRPLVFAVIGDTGQTEVTHALFERLGKLVGSSDAAAAAGADDADAAHDLKIDLLLHTGDLSYADGYPPRWDTFGRLSEPLLSGVPMLVTPGNHDVTLNGLESTAFRTRYPAPHRASRSPSPDWWSLDVGLAHVVGLSSYVAASPRRDARSAVDGAPLRDDSYSGYAENPDGDFEPFGLDGALAESVRHWLRADLKRVDRSKTPWVIVMFHVPWYNSNSGHFKEAERHRWALEKVLYDGGVDFVLNGHVHAYERSANVYDWRVDACGPAHLVVGDGGNYEGPYGGGWRSPQPAWSAFREGSFGAGYLALENATHATWTWHRTTCVEAAGVTRFNETRYEPVNGTDGERCRTSNDVSAVAAEPVDFARFKRDVERCPNRMFGGSPTQPAANESRGSEDESSSSRCVPSANANGANANAAVAILAAGWTGTAACLAWALVSLRRERRGVNAFRHARLGDDDTL